MVAAMQHRGPPAELGDAIPKPPTPMSAAIRFRFKCRVDDQGLRSAPGKSARLRELQLFLYSL